MYTGLPLMPLITPVCSNGPPESRARIMSMRGPKYPFNTPKISTWKVSICGALEGRQPKAAHASAQLAWLHERLSAEARERPGATTPVQLLCEMRSARPFACLSLREKN